MDIINKMGLFKREFEVPVVDPLDVKTEAAVVGEGIVMQSLVTEQIN